MKCIFIPLGLKRDKFSIIVHEEQGKFDFKHDEKHTYTLYEINQGAYILRPDQQISSNIFWKSDKINELYQKLKSVFPDEEDPFVLAIHWGGNDFEPDSEELCENRRKKLEKSISKKVFLTHYSGKHDSEYLEKVSIDGINIDIMIDMIKKRIKWKGKKDKIKVVYELKEYLLRSLFPLTLGQELEDKQKRRIKKYITSKKKDIGDEILQSIKEKSSVFFKLPEGKKSFTSEEYTEKLKKLRKYLNMLIDEQLKKAGKEVIYGH